MRLSRDRLVMLVAVVSLFAVGAEGEDSGCDCNLCEDLEGTVRRSESVDDEDRTIEKLVTIDPSSNDDVQRNRDRIERGRVKRMSLQVISLRDENRATTIQGEIRVRPVGSEDDAWITIVRDWSEVPLLAGNEYPLSIDPAVVDALSNIVFGADSGPVEVEIRGETNQSPVHFDFELTMELAFEGCA